MPKRIPRLSWFLSVPRCGHKGIGWSWLRVPRKLTATNIIELVWMANSYGLGETTPRISYVHLVESKTQTHHGWFGTGKGGAGWGGAGQDAGGSVRSGNNRPSCFRIQNPDIARAGRVGAAHGGAAGLGGAGQDGTPTERFAQETPDPRTPQGIERTCPERL